MSQKLAVLVSVALTVFVVMVAGALAVRLGSARPDVAPSADSSQAVLEERTQVLSPWTMEVAQQRDQQYRQRLDEADTRLRRAGEQLRQLQAQRRELQSQNTMLLDRERTYQQQLQEANRLLQQFRLSTSPNLNARGGDVQEAMRIADVETAATGQEKRGKRTRDHERSHERREHDEEDDDDKGVMAAKDPAADGVADLNARRMGNS
jgi:hypothetical protein